MIRLVTTGKNLAIIIGQTGVNFKLVKANTKYFLVKNRKRKPDGYIVDAERRVPADYPPFAPSFMKAHIYAMLYAEGNQEALDPKTVSIIPKKSTARIMGVAVSEKIVEDIASTVNAEAEGKKKLSDMIFPLITLAAIVILVILIWQMKGDMAILQQAIQKIPIPK
jgi:hypothetical protein